MGYSVVSAYLSYDDRSVELCLYTRLKTINICCRLVQALCTFQHNLNDVIISELAIVGADSTQTVLWSCILDRLHGLDPPQLLVIDPRKSNSAKAATLHLANRIGTNLALLNGIQYRLFKKGYVNEEYIQDCVINRDKLYNTVKDYPLEIVSKITGVAEKDIERAADILGETPSLLSTCLQGVC